MEEEREDKERGGVGTLVPVLVDQCKESTWTWRDKQQFTSLAREADKEWEDGRGVMINKG